MSANDRRVAWYRDSRAQFLLLLVVTLFTVLFNYHMFRAHWLEIGSLGDAPFLTGFYSDEADVTYRYRWTTNHAEIVFPGTGSARPESVSLAVDGTRPAGIPQPVTMSVSLNGIPLQLLKAGRLDSGTAVTLSNFLTLYDFQPAKEQRNDGRLAPPYIVSVDIPTFQPAGDARQLGAKLNYVSLKQENQGLNLPPWWIVLWILVFIAGAYGALSALAGGPGGRLAGLIVALVLAVPLYISLISYRPYLAVYFPPIASAIGIVGLLVWQRDRVRRWPEAVDAMRSGRLAPLVMGAAMSVYAVIALWVLPQVDWIGHADYAENAVIARNLVGGKGLTVDYMAQFYKDYGPSISHPADTWPLLQPLLIAPFFALFGPIAWVAKLPNLFLLLALAWAVFSAASMLWDGRVGLLAGLMVLVHPYFFSSVLYPINDLAFTLIFFVLAWLVWRNFSPFARDDTGTASVSPTTRTSLLIGALAGLLVWSKPSGAVLLIGLVIWALWSWRGWRTQHSALSTQHWKALALSGAAAIVVLLPLIVRNLLAFGTPFFSTEGYDAWILRYWPLHEWEDIYKYYIGSELPHPRWVVGGKFGYQNLVDAITLNFRWVWQKGVLSDPSQGDYVMGLLPLSGALVGLAATSRRVRNLFAMVGFSLGLYTLFVLLYWHFEGRYFQVVVPWLYMLLAWGVFWVWDRIRILDLKPASEAVSKIGVPSGPPKSKIEGGLLIFLPIMVVGLLWPSLSAISDQIQADTQPTGFVTAMEWLKQNSAPQDVIMTRDPWELNWYTDRKAVMIPNDDLATIERTAKKYGVTMLQLGGPVDGINTRRCPDATGSRPALGKLYCGEERPGYKLVYRQGGLTIYRVTGDQ